MHIVAVGLNHKVAPVEVREKLSFSRAGLEEAVARLCPPDDSCPYVPEGVILSTCNRLEIYGLAPSLDEGKETICGFLEDCHDQSQENSLED